MSQNNMNTNFTPILEKQEMSDITLTKEEEIKNKEEGCCECCFKCCTSLLDSGCCFFCGIFLMLSNK